MFIFINEGDEQESTSVVVCVVEELLQNSKATLSTDEGVCIYVIFMNCNFKCSLKQIVTVSAKAFVNGIFYTLCFFKAE